MTYCYYNGQILAEKEIHIPISDRGFQFGDGAFAVIQVQDGIPLFLETHMERLKKQCASFHLAFEGVDKEAIEHLIEANQAYEGIWRLKLMITGGDGIEWNLPNRTGRVIIQLKPFSVCPIKPLKVGLFSIPYYSCHASFKTLAHLNRFYVMEEAQRQGLDDCITRTEKGYLLEAAFGNLFWVREKDFFTPDPSLPLYFGVTAKNSVDLAQKMGFNVHFVKQTAVELPRDITPFRTNTMHTLRPIAQIGDIVFNRSSTAETLFLNAYQNLIKEYKERRQHKLVQL